MMRTLWQYSRLAGQAPVFLLLLPALCGVGEARADSNKHWARYNGWEVTDYHLEGLSESLVKLIQPHLALTGKRKLFGVKRPVFQVDLLAEDLARIRLFLARQGYPAAKAVPQEDARRESRQLAILVKIDPGPSVKVGKVLLSGWPDRSPRPGKDDAAVIRPGDVFRDEALLQAADRIRMLLLDEGFTDVEVTSRVIPAGDWTVNVEFLVVPGDFQVVDRLEIRGCSDDLQGVARRVADFTPGMDFSETRVQDMARDLRWTQLFRQVEMSTSPVTPGHLLLHAELENARMRTWTASIGTWADNPWMVKVGWVHRNLFRHGVGFDSRASLATHEVNAGLGVFWLGWLTPRARTRAGIEYLVEDEDAYKSKEKLVDLVQAFRPNNRDALKVGITFSFVDVEVYYADIGETPEDEGRLLEFWCDWKLDLTDDPIFPRAGSYLKLSGTIAPPGKISESPYISGRADFVAFHGLPGDFVLAGRIRTGWANPLAESTDLLATRRFYAGGFNTMRGYSRRALGPRDSAGNPRGGQATALAGLEMRFPLVGIFDGAVFVDSGQVWRRWREMSPADIAAAWGLALDVRTPIGPLRLNHSWNFRNIQPEEPKRLWLFGIGYPW